MQAASAVTLPALRGHQSAPRPALRYQGSECLHAPFGRLVLYKVAWQHTVYSRWYAMTPCKGSPFGAQPG
eukprot:1138965-Pelagomonas_calceolata.AAC.1